MLKTLWNGRSGLYSNQNRLDIISNNIGNVNTNGYKRMDVSFQDIFNENMDRVGLPITSSNREDMRLGSGSKGDILVRNTYQGSLNQTSREEDMAIDGGGYFRLKDGKGNYFYSRDGSFNLDINGNLVHSSGMILDVENYDAANAKKPLSIDVEGNIYSNEAKIGKINLYDFVNSEDLVAAGNNLFIANGQEQKATGQIRQGFLEQSNVDIAKELTDMMITQRAYELNSKSVKAADEMWQIANNLRSK